MPTLNWNIASDRPELAVMLAVEVAGRLAEAVAQRGRATLAVSGGSTPKLFFEQLCDAPIDWSRVTVTLVDERFVEEDSPRSNARLVKTSLLRGAARAAAFVPLRGDAGTAGEAARQAALRIEEKVLPLDVLVLGMGLDGHTASFFPDAATLSALLDPAAGNAVAAVEAASAGEPRLTMTLPALLSTGFTALHIEGADKRAALDAALSGTPPLPIRRVVEALPGPVEVYWAP